MLVPVLSGGVPLSKLIPAEVGADTAAMATIRFSILLLDGMVLLLEAVLAIDSLDVVRAEVLRLSFLFLLL